MWLNIWEYKSVWTPWMWIWMTCCKKLKNRVWSVMLLDLVRSTEIFKLEKQVVRMKEEDFIWYLVFSWKCPAGVSLPQESWISSVQRSLICPLCLCFCVYGPEFLNNIGKSISLPKPRCSGPKAWLWKHFIYSVGVWWRSHAVYPNNRLSFWWRRHTDRTQQPEFIPLKYCLLPGRSQGHIRALGHVHTYEDGHGKSLHFLYEYSSQCLSQMLIYLFK